MGRPKLVAGNWKMYTKSASARELAAAIRDGLRGLPAVNVVLCPPFPWLTLVAETLRGTDVALGAQDVYPGDEAAFTGEVSAAMLRDAGCAYVIVGHSERRYAIGENDAIIHQKAKAVLESGLSPIFCVGEKLDDRDGNRTESVLDNQLTWGLKDLPRNHISRLVIAYEPVWAIGTGRNATPKQAQQAHVFIRWRFGQLFGSEHSEALRILYGGSVKPDNAVELLSEADVDGALVGGASLKSDSFLRIVAAAA